MAEEPIRKEDIIDLSGTQESINELIKTLENLSVVMRKDLKGAADELEKSLQGVNAATKEGQERIRNAATASENLAAQDKEMSKIDKETIQLKARLNALSSEEANNVAKLKVAIESKNKAMKDAARLDDSAEGSVNKMRARLKELTAEYNKLGGAARKEVAPAINKLTEELKKAEGAIGNNTRGVGNYKQSIIGAAKELLGFAGITGLAMGALKKLKDAFFETEQGAKVAKVWGEGLKAFFQSMVTGNMQMAGANALVAATVGKQMNEIRKGDRKDMIEIVRLETDISILRYKAADATLSEGEQLKALSLAQEKENQLIAYKIKDKQEELDAVNLMLTARMDDINLLNQQSQLEAEIIRMEGDRNLRIESRASGLREKQAKRAADEKAEAEKLAKFLIDSASTVGTQKANIEQLTSVTIDGIKEQGLIKNQDFYDKQTDQIEKAKAKQDQIDKEYEDLKKQRAGESLQRIGESLNVLSGLYEANKQRELSAAGDNAEARLEIERKYAKKQQALGIGQALINGALAVTEIWKKWAGNPIIAGILTALTVAQVAMQVAVIKSQKFAKGGAGVLNGPVHASGGIQIPGIGEAEGGEHFAITSRVMTSKYGSKMLDAVSNSINQGKFFEVWSNVNKSMGTTDPYTKKMYELMSNTPTIYTDTQGDTVKEYPNGQKYIIKRMNIWKN